MKLRTTKILIGLAFVAGFFALPASAQVIPTNLWNPNYASSTITPRPSTLQIPCANIVGGCVSGATTSTINGVTGPSFTFSIVPTSSASSITTSSAQVFLNLLKYTSSSDITISPTGTIVFANHNISQFTNDSGYITTSTNNFGGITNASVTANSPITWSTTSTISCPTCSTVSTSSANTWSQPQTFNGVSNTGNVTSTSYTAANPTSTVNFASGINFDTVLYASTNEQGLDHGTYVNTLCQAGLTNASSVNVIFPQENIASSNWNVPIIDSYNGGACTYTGQGPYSTIWNWGGTTSTAATAENAGDANVLWGYGMNDLSIYGYYTAAAPGLLIGGANPGGGQGFSNNNLVIKYFANDEVIATNTYLGMQTGGYIGAASTSALTYNSVSNAGEGLLFDHVTFADTVQPSSTVQNCILIQGGFSQIEFTNSHFDDCGQTITSAASYGTEVLTADYWENTAGDTIGAYIPIANNSTGVTVEAYGGQDTNDASSSVSPGGFITNSGTFINNGMTAFQNSTGVQTRFVTDNSTGNDYDYGFSNPNGAVSHYKVATTQTGSLVYSAAVANSLPYSVSVTATTTYIYAQGGTTPIETINAGHINQGSGAIATTSVFENGSWGGCAGITSLSSTITTAACHWIISTNTQATTSTLPAVNGSQGDDLAYLNRGTTAESIAASTTAPDFLHLCTNVTSTAFSLLPGSSTEFYDDNTYWDQICYVP